MAALVVCLVVMLTLVAMLRPVISLQMQSVFAPRGSRWVVDASRMQNTAGGRLLLWVSTVVWATSLAVGTMHVVEASRIEQAANGIEQAANGVEMAAGCFWISLALWFGFIVLRRCLAWFINWVFFPAQARYEWECVYRLAMTSNALCTLAVVLVAVCNGLSAQTTCTLGILACIPAFSVTIWGSWRLFFGNLLGCLHFLLYLCTLEVLLPFAAVIAQYTTTQQQ